MSEESRGRGEIQKARRSQPTRMIWNVRERAMRIVSPQVLREATTIIRVRGRT
jgi:hypothetical protein